MISDNEKKFVGTMMTILDERGKRLFLGSYAECLGQGGVLELSKVSGISKTTIIRGRTEAQEIKGEEPENRKKGQQRVRTPGAGRKSIEKKYPHIQEELLKLLNGNTVGNPENPLCWTTKSLRNLEKALAEKGIETNYVTIGGLLEGMGFSLQQNRKYTEAGDAGPDRDAQYHFINDHARGFLESGLPVISIDTKKKKMTGNLKNGEVEYRPETDQIEVNDHVFPDPKLGKASPYGIYNIGRDTGYVSVGLSADTGAFAVNSIRSWWIGMGKEHYPHATKLMVTADGCGSNGRRNRLWKVSLQELANEIGLEIYVSHFPPGTSKWNWIEHRLFSQISKNWRGRPLETIQVIVSLIASSTTKEGLTVQCEVDENTYERGIKISDEELMPLNLTPNEWHGEWNYIIAPQVKPKS